MVTNPAMNLRETIRHLVRLLGVLEKNEASCCQLGITQCHAVVEVGRAGAMSLNELAELLLLDKSTMSRTVNQLVESDLVKREPQSDRRFVNIELTESGQRTFEQTEQTMQNYYERVLVNIPEAKRAMVLESLELLNQAITDSKCCL